MAVVGGSPVRGKVGNTVLDNITKFNFRGRVYVVNPKYSEVLGFKSYQCLRELPEKPDVVVIAVPANAAVDVIREAAELKVKLAIVMSSGFSEVGRLDLQASLEDIVKNTDIRVIGPNSAGITLSRHSLHASIEVIPTEGSIGIIAQSGAVGGVVISELRKYSSGVSFFISLGNCLDISVEEVLEYGSEDDRTSAVVLYLEWLRNGREFIKNSLKLLKVGKPLCVLKGGVGECSSEAVRSHTGGLAPNFEVFKTAVSKVGGYLATDILEAVEVCELSRRLKQLIPSRVLIVTNSGGLGVLTASSLELHGFKLPKPPYELINASRDLSLKVSLANPIDLGGDSRIEDLTTLLTLDMLRKYYDVAVLAYVPTAAEPPEEIARVVGSQSKGFSLPVIGYFAGEGAVDIITKVSRDLPVSSSSWFLGKALSFIREFNLRRESHESL